MSVVDGWFALRRNCQRVETLLFNKAYEVNLAYRKTTGRKRKQLDDKVYKLSIRRNETETMESLKSELEKSRVKLEEWKQKYIDLEAEKEKLYEQLKKEIHLKDQEITDLTQVIKDLVNYVEFLERRETLKCQGKKFHELGAKQQGRKLCHLKNKAQCALWFCKSFGLELNQITLQDEEGLSHNLNYRTPMSSPCTYANLIIREDKNKVEQVLFLLDKFGVGDEVYHELTMVFEGMPKSYLVKQLRSNVNKTYHIERTPGKFPGGDMKFLLMFLGLNSATADYACLWCKIHKDDQWDTSKPCNHYNEDPQRRNLDEIKQMVHSKDNFGCKHKPVTDKLLQNVIDKVFLERCSSRFYKTKRATKRNQP
ncbi:hypothetical protein ACROYT_G014911 [Oculina patagonica]